MATDPKSGRQIRTPVVAVHVHRDTLMALAVDGEVIVTTEDHPFWSVTDQRFERTDELSGGELVLSADGSMVRVVGLRVWSAHTGWAYNLSVQGIHTYHVGHHEILVHNTCVLPTQVIGATERLTTAQARDLAQYLGYRDTLQFVRGERVFRKGALRG